MWTEQAITNLLKPETNPDYERAVTRAIIAIYNNQTLDEKQCEHTIQKNGIGFSASDSHIGSYMAKYAIKTNKPISGQYLVKAQKIALKYRKQLLTIANSKV